MTNNFAVIFLVFPLIINNAIAQQENLENSLSSIIQFETDRVFEMDPFSSRSTENQFSNTYVPGVSTEINVSRGEISASVNDVNDIGYSSSGVIYETLNFDNINNGSLINYQIDLDFELSPPLLVENPVADPQINFAVSIFDITDLDTWLEPVSRIFGPSFDLIDDIFTRSEARRIERTAGTVRWDLILTSGFDVGLDESFPFGTRPDSKITGELSFAHSFFAREGTTYGLTFALTTFSLGSDAMADIAFQFTDLNGATFESGSGAFLSGANINPVPLPPAIWLFLFGVMFLFSYSRFNKE